MENEKVLKLLEELKIDLDVLEKRVTYLEKITKGRVVYGSGSADSIKFWGK